VILLTIELLQTRGKENEMKIGEKVVLTSTVSFSSFE